MTYRALKTPTAIVTKGDKTFFVTSDTGTEAFDFGPVLPLVLGVYDKCNFDSLHVLRQRIYTSAPEESFSRSVVKIGAKSCSFGCRIELPANAEGKWIDVSPIAVSDPTSVRLEQLIGQRLTPEEARQWCHTLLSTIPLEQERFYSSRPVATLLVNAQHELLGAAVNTNAINRLRHAEVNLVLNLNLTPTRKLERGAILYTTLSPCVMCASLLAKVSADGYEIRVVAARMDQGRYGRHGILANVGVANYDFESLKMDGNTEISQLI